MLELFQYQFFVNAFLAAILVSISCGIIGVYIVSRRMVFISDGITHACFGGIGIGYYLGIDPIIGATGFGVLSALVIEIMVKKTEVREDSIIGILWSSGMAIGIIFVYLTPGYAPNLMSYLFGNILTVSTTDIYSMAVLNLVILMIFGLLFKEIMSISFDEQYVRTQGISTGIINSVLICLVALTIVISIRAVGIILVMSMLTIPQAIANLFCKSFKYVIFYSIGIGATASIAGLFASYNLRIPSGACIIVSSVIIFMIAFLVKKIHTRYLLQNKQS